MLVSTVKWQGYIQGVISIEMCSLFLSCRSISPEELPVSDYITHLKSVLDESIRIIHAMIDICANSRWLESALTFMNLLQMITRGSRFIMNSRHCLPSSSVFAMSKCSMKNKHVKLSSFI
jgi:hypothetical protein